MDDLVLPVVSKHGGINYQKTWGLKARAKKFFLGAGYHDNKIKMSTFTQQNLDSIQDFYLVPCNFQEDLPI